MTVTEQMCYDCEDDTPITIDGYHFEYDQYDPDTLEQWRCSRWSFVFPDEDA